MGDQLQWQATLCPLLCLTLDNGGPVKKVRTLSEPVRRV
jgi:hypothetical protein